MLEELLSVPHRAHPPSASAEEGFEKQTDLTILLVIGAQKRHIRKPPAVAAERFSVHRHREIDPKLFAAQEARFHHVPRANEDFIALTLTPLVRRMLRGIGPILQQLRPEVAVVAPLHLHPLIWFDDCEERNQVTFERIVINRIGIFEIGRRNLESPGTISTATQSFENDDVLAEITIDSF